MIIALIAIIVVGLIVWAAASVAVNTGDQVQSLGAGGSLPGSAPTFPSPTDVWNSISAPAAAGAASAKGAFGSATAAAGSAFSSTASIEDAAKAGGNPPPGKAGAPAPPAPKGGIFSFIPGWDQPTGTNVNTSVTSIPGAPQIREGQSYKCTTEQWAIYRGFNGTLRLYPSPTIAGSWDTNWGSPTTIDCSKVERGPPMEMNPDPKMIEGHAYTCAEGGVYRAMNGMLRWYPSVPVAQSWDPAWASPVKIDCSNVKKGPPMSLAPSPAMPTSASSEHAPVRADTSVMENRMKAIVDDLNHLHAQGYFRTNSGNVKINEEEYKQLAPKLQAAGVSWMKPKYDPNSPSNALL